MNDQEFGNAVLELYQKRIDSAAQVMRTSIYVGVGSTMAWGLFRKDTLK